MKTIQARTETIPPVKTIQATDLRTHTREILESVRWRGETFSVTTFGQPVAVIVPVEVFQRWNELSATAEIKDTIPEESISRKENPC